MKKIFTAILAASCLLTACGAESGTAENDIFSETSGSAPLTETVSVTSYETTVPETTSAAETFSDVTTGTDPLDTAAALILGGGGKELSEEELENAAKLPEVTSYETVYTVPEYVSEEELNDEQKKLYDFYCAGRNYDDMRSVIEESRTNMLAHGDSGGLLDTYKIYDGKYFGDFDGDGDLELYVYRSTCLDTRSNWSDYRDLWYTDGTKLIQLYYGVNRGDFAGIAEIENGLPVFFIVPEIMMGSAVQTAYGFVVKDGVPKLYEHPEDECFMYDVSDLLIYRTEFGFDEFERAVSDWEYNGGDWNAKDKGKFQTLGWVNGKIEINAGYGAEE